MKEEGGSREKILETHGTFHILFRFFYWGFLRYIYFQSLISSGYFQGMCKLSHSQNNLQEKMLIVTLLWLPWRKQESWSLCFHIKMYFSFLRMTRKECLLVFQRQKAAILMHPEYRVKFPDQDFLIGEKHKLIPSNYAVCEKKQRQFYWLQRVDTYSCSKWKTRQKCCYFIY